MEHCPTWKVIDKTQTSSSLMFPQFMPTGNKNWPSTHQLEWNML